MFVGGMEEAHKIKVSFLVCLSWVSVTAKTDLIESRPGQSRTEMDDTPSDTHSASFYLQMLRAELWYNMATSVQLFL